MPESRPTCRCFSCSIYLRGRWSRKPSWETHTSTQAPGCWRKSWFLNCAENSVSWPYWDCHLPCCWYKDLGLGRVWQVGSFACWCHRNGRKIKIACLWLQRGICLLIVSRALDVSCCWAGTSSQEEWRGYSYKAPVSCSALKSWGFLKICIL